MTLQQDYELAQRLRTAEQHWPEVQRQQAVEVQRLQTESDLEAAKAGLRDAADLRRSSWERFEALLTEALKTSESVVRAWESYRAADSQVSAHAGRVAQLEMTLSGEALEAGHGNVLSYRAELDMHRNKALDLVGAQPLVFRLPVNLSEAALGLIDALQVPIRPAAQQPLPIDWSQFENKAADAEAQRFAEFERRKRADNAR